MIGTIQETLRAWIHVDGVWREIEKCLSVTLGAHPLGLEISVTSEDRVALEAIRAAFLHNLPVNVRGELGEISESFKARVMRWELGADASGIVQWSATLREWL